MNDGWPPLGPGLNAFDGDPEALYEHCYSVYETDFYRSKPDWPVADKEFKLMSMPRDARGWCRTFWHITSYGDDELTRIPDLARMERIAWPRMLIDDFCYSHPAPTTGRSIWWLQDRGRTIRYLIALADFSYLVVIEDRRDYVLLVTAYAVEHENRRLKLKKECDAYWLSQAAS